MYNRIPEYECPYRIACMYPRLESNQYLLFRRELFYPIELRRHIAQVVYTSFLLYKCKIIFILSRNVLGLKKLMNHRPHYWRYILFAMTFIFVIGMFIDQGRTTQALYINTAKQETTNHVINMLALYKSRFTREYNLVDDASLQKYISKDTPFENTSYQPAELVNIQNSYIVIGTQDPRLRPEAAQAFHDLAKAFYTNFGYKLYLVSAYRPYESQVRLLENGCSPSRCAQPGTSEHQAGLAIDIHIASTQWLKLSMSKKSKYYRRLEHNAHKFGWHNTFQKWIDIDGQMEEWWHRRYLWKWFAQMLYENDRTIREYRQITQDNLAKNN